MSSCLPGPRPGSEEAAGLLGQSPCKAEWSQEKEPRVNWTSKGKGTMPGVSTHVISSGLWGNHSGDIIHFILYPRTPRLSEGKEPPQHEERKELGDLESELRTTCVLFGSILTFSFSLSISYNRIDSTSQARPMRPRVLLFSMHLKITHWQRDFKSLCLCSTALTPMPPIKRGWVGTRSDTAENANLLRSQWEEKISQWPWVTSK